MQAAVRARRELHAKTETVGVAGSVTFCQAVRKAVGFRQLGLFDWPDCL